MLLAIIAVSCFFYRHPIIFDATYNKNNSLSPGNIELISKIQKPLYIDFFTSEKNIGEQVYAIISLFQEKNNNIHFNIHYNPLMPEEKSRLGLHSNHNLMLSYGERSKNVDINILKWNQQAFSNLLQQILQEKEPWVVFLSGHGEQDPLSQENKNLSVLATELKNKGVKVAAINIGETGVIPDNTQTLVIADSQGAFLPHETNEIIHYLNRGGNLLWLVNPHSANNFEILSTQLGITWVKGTILDPQGYSMGTPDPAISLITQYPAHPITEKLTTLTVFPWATPFEYSNALAQGWKVNSLLNTNASTLIKEAQEHQGPFTIGAAFTRGTQRVVVIGNGYFLSNGTIHNYGNLILAHNIFNWLNETNILLTAHNKPAADFSFTQNTWSRITIQYLFPYGLSFIYLFIAWYTRYKRRYKHRAVTSH